jgi:hypothetical protein
MNCISDKIKSYLDNILTFIPIAFEALFESSFILALPFLSA